NYTRTARASLAANRDTCGLFVEQSTEDAEKAPRDGCAFRRGELVRVGAVEAVAARGSRRGVLRVRARPSSREHGRRRGRDGRVSTRRTARSQVGGNSRSARGAVRAHESADRCGRGRGARTQGGSNQPRIELDSRQL